MSLFNIKEINGMMYEVWGVGCGMWGACGLWVCHDVERQLGAMFGKWASRSSV